MKKFDLKVNCRIELEYEGTIYKSVIQDIEEDGILISIPAAAGEYLTLYNNESVIFNSYIDNNNLYRVTCSVLGKVVSDNLRLYKLSPPINIERIQRRNFVRVKVLKEIKYIKLDGSEDTKKKKAMLLDISGGGVRIKCKEELDFCDSILLDMNIEGVQISLIGEVVRIETPSINEKIFGIEFKNQTLSQTDSIMRAVFNIMRKQRQLT